MNCCERSSARPKDDQYLDKDHGGREKALQWARLKWRRKPMGLLVKRVAVYLNGAWTQITARGVLVQISVPEVKLLSCEHRLLEYSEHIPQLRRV